MRYFIFIKLFVFGSSYELFEDYEVLGFIRLYLEGYY